MNNVKAIRRLLGVTQQAMADSLNCAQSNVGHYERGQTLPPHMARRVIDFAAEFGVVIGFDHIYGDKPLPEARRITTATTSAQKVGAHG